MNKLINNFTTLIDLMKKGHTTLPTPNENKNSTNTYTQGFFYTSTIDDDTADPVTYKWQEIELGGGGDTIQVETLPTASASEVGNIYQYIGATTATLTNGYFYECVEDSGSYNWVEKEVQKNEDVPHWSGTRAEYEAQKDNIEDGTYVSILDDIDTHELVDVVEEDNMNPVTSNAVYDEIKVVSGTCTKPSNISANVYDCKYVQFGKVVVVYMYIAFTSSIAASTAYVTGLPKAAEKSTTQLTGTDSTDSLRAYILANGTSIRNQDQAMGTVGAYTGQLVYICQ